MSGRRSSDGRNDNASFWKCRFRLRLHCKRNKLVRELEETVRLASSLHTQLKRSVISPSKSRAERVAGR